MTFVQIIEYKTTRMDEVNALIDRWMAETDGRRTASRSIVLSDRDQAGTVVVVVEFPSFEEAMKNSELPETSKLAKQISELCDGPAVYRNLDLIRQEKL